MRETLYKLLSYTINNIYLHDSIIIVTAPQKFNFVLWSFNFSNSMKSYFADINTKFDSIIKQLSFQYESIKI